MVSALPLRASGGSVSREIRHNLHKYLIGYLFTCGFNYAPWDCVFILFVQQNFLSLFLKPKQPEEATWHFYRCIRLLSPSARLKVLSVGFCSGLSPKCFKEAEMACCRGELSVVQRSNWRDLRSICRSMEQVSACSVTPCSVPDGCYGIFVSGSLPGEFVFIP